VFAQKKKILGLRSARSSAGAPPAAELADLRRGDSGMTLSRTTPTIDCRGGRHCRTCKIRSSSLKQSPSLLLCSPDAEGLRHFTSVVGRTRRAAYRRRQVVPAASRALDLGRKRSRRQEDERNTGSVLMKSLTGGSLLSMREQCYPGVICGFPGAPNRPRVGNRPGFDSSVC
jgi:hypothetical protein